MLFLLFIYSRKKEEVQIKQLTLTLASIDRQQKNVYLKYANSKRRSKENPSQFA